ncbi:DUF948 domain-containing protein, partial [bacterium]|nr:DUF948 domain-containing protein [bacterium]
LIIAIAVAFFLRRLKKSLDGMDELVKDLDEQIIPLTEQLKETTEHINQITSRLDEGVETVYGAVNWIVGGVNQLRSFFAGIRENIKSHAPWLAKSLRIGIAVAEKTEKALLEKSENNDK